MTALTLYRTGTVSVDAGGTIVTGTGTIWSGVNARPGDILQIGNFQTIITDVTDVTHLVIPPWGGGAQANVAYAIWQWFPQRVAGAQAMADVSALVAALNTTGFFVFVGPVLTAPDRSLGEDNQYALQPTTGKMWVKSGGNWTYLGMYRGFGVPAPYDNAKTYSLMDVATSGGSSYVWINAAPGSGHAPPDPTYWAVLASKGDQGPQGVQGAPGTNGTNAPTYGGTSATSLTIGTGAQTFATQAGLAYQNGARVRASSSANPSSWMEGIATYAGTTLTITVDKTNGAGTIASWNFNVVGQPGAGDMSSSNYGSEYAGNTAQVRTNIAAATVIKTAAYTALPSDIAGTLLLNGTFTLAFTAAATLTSKWYVTVKNIGSGIITLDPNAAELVDGALTIPLLPGQSCDIVCDGSAFQTLRLSNEVVTKLAVSSAQASIVLPLPAGYSFHEVIIDELMPASDSNLQLVVSTDGGVTYAGSGSYKYAYDYCDLASGAALTVGGSTSDVCVLLSGGQLASASGHPIEGRLSIFDVLSTANAKTVLGEVGFTASGPARRRLRAQGEVLSSAAITHLKLQMSTGNIAAATVTLRSRA